MNLSGNFKRTNIFHGVALLLAVFLLTAGSASDNTITFQGRVEHVYDGDTYKVRLDTGKTETVRLLGVDTPESYIRRFGYIEFLGHEAHVFAASQLRGKNIRLEGVPHRDGIARDRYNRLLAFVYQENHDICAMLLQKGLARVYRKSPSPRHNEFLRIESEAKAAGLGIWNAVAEKAFYRKQFTSGRNKHLLLWFWENDREFLRQIFCDTGNPP